METTAFAAYQAAAKSSPKKAPKPKKNPTKSNARPPIVVVNTETAKNKKKRKQPELQPELNGGPPQKTKEIRIQPPQAKSQPKKTATQPQIQNNNPTKSKPSAQPSNGIQQRKVTNGIASATTSNGFASASSSNGSALANTSIQDLQLSSVHKGAQAFARIINNPEYGMKDFMNKFWENAPIHVGRQGENYYKYLNVSTHAIDEMLRTNVVEFTKNIDVTSYENGVRETHNPEGRALPATVWDFYRNGCSIRLLNPATFITPLQKVNADLQEYFHCLVGANVYLTPPNSQGFAPHYDDIEAFVLQIEGKKHWYLYPPRTPDEVLPRESSGNFQQDEIGEPAWDGVLEPGDLLYFPRGWIHQAKTVDNSHSLHITLSVYQKNCYGDLFEELVKETLNKAMNSDQEFRKGVPLELWNNFGATHSHSKRNSSKREAMKQHMMGLFKNLLEHVDFDDAVDRMAMKFQHDALPPVLSKAEKERTTFGTKAVLQDDGEVIMPEVDECTEVRLLRAHIVRLTQIDGANQLYYYVDNLKEYHGSDLNFIEVEDETVDVIKTLISSYPAYVQIKALSENPEDALGVVHSLWERGLLMTKEPLEITYE